MGWWQDTKDWVGTAKDDVWKTMSGRSDWDAKAPMLDRSGPQGIDQAAQAQQDFSGQLGAAAAGRGPTAAGAQFQRQSEIAQRQARGMAAGNTSGNAALALRASADAGAQGRGMAANDAAQLRAKEMQAAQQLQAQNLAQQRSQAFQESAANQSSILTNQGYSAGISAGNAQRAGSGLSGLASAAGGAISLLSDERAKTEVEPTSGEPGGGYMDRLMAGAGRVIDRTGAAYQDEMQRGDTLPDGSRRRFEVETPEEAARVYDAYQKQQAAEAWARLQEMADRQAERDQMAADPARGPSSSAGFMSGLDVPDAPSRGEARRAYKHLGMKPPSATDSEQRAKEGKMDFSSILSQATSGMGGGGDAMGGISAAQYTGGQGGGTNYFSGGGYDPLSDVRAKRDVVPSGQPELRGSMPQAGPEATGDFSRAQTPVSRDFEELDRMQREHEARSQPTAARDFEELNRMLAVYEAKKRGERGSLDALQGDAMRQFDRLPTEPMDRPALPPRQESPYSRFDSASWR